VNDIRQAQNTVIKNPFAVNRKKRCMKTRTRREFTPIYRDCNSDFSSQKLRWYYNSGYG
jgi:hypothetical protein